MQVKTGVDIVHLPTFSKSLDGGGEAFLARLFTDGEIKKQRVEHIAGLFALKEAVIKALGLPAGSWHTIIVRHESTGKPIVSVDGQAPSSVDVSIAHHYEYAVASVVFLYE
jgi:phosphopantetheine--protein transferase-like protein